MFLFPKKSPREKTIEPEIKKTETKYEKFFKEYCALQTLFKEQLENFNVISCKKGLDNLLNLIFSLETELESSSNTFFREFLTHNYYLGCCVHAYGAMLFTNEVEFMKWLEEAKEYLLEIRKEEFYYHCPELERMLNSITNASSYSKRLLKQSIQLPHIKKMLFKTLDFDITTLFEKHNLHNDLSVSSVSSPRSMS